MITNPASTVGPPKWLMALAWRVNDAIEWKIAHDQRAEARFHQRRRQARRRRRQRADSRRALLVAVTRWVR